MRIYANFMPKKALFFRTGAFETLTGYLVSMSIINDRFKYPDGSEGCGWVAPTMGGVDGSNGLVRMAWENR